MSFNYDDQGSRVSKTVNGITTTYQYEGNKVVYEEQKNNDIIIYSLAYTYDEVGNQLALHILMVAFITLTFTSLILWVML
jgi:hypothetical protein